MSKQKTSARRWYHTAICIMLIGVLMLLVRYPIVFLDSWYGLTRWFYVLTMIGLLGYSTWLFRRLRLRYVAVLLVIVAILVGTFSFSRFSLPFDAECDVYPPTRRVCFMDWVDYDSLTYAHWSEVTFFYTVGDMPVGIWYQSRVLE
ncbi:MAG: hypothetical protein AAFN11_18965 [Chloroflexota bacterium]